MYEIQPEQQTSCRYILALDEGYSITQYNEKCYHLKCNSNVHVALPNTVIAKCKGKYTHEDGTSVTESSYIVSKRVKDILLRAGALDNQESILEIPGPDRLTKQPSYLIGSTTKSIGVLREVTKEYAERQDAYTQLPSGAYLIAM